MGSDFRDLPEFIFGEEGEHAIANKLIVTGRAVHPVYQYENHDSPPLLYTEHGGLVLPDLLCFGPNRPSFFAEVKRKRQYVHWQGRRETGFNDRLCKQYLRVQDATGLKVWVFFIHEDEPPTGVFVAALDHLMPTCRPWDGLHYRTKARISPPLALFDSTVLHRMWSLDEVGLRVAA